MADSFRCVSQQLLKHEELLVTLRHPTGDHVVVGSYDRRVVRCFLGLGWWNSIMDAWYTTHTHTHHALRNDGFFLMFLCCFLSFRISQDWVLYIMDKMAIHDKPDRMFRNLQGFRIRSLKGTSFGCIASYCPVVVFGNILESRPLSIKNCTRLDRYKKNQ